MANVNVPLDPTALPDWWQREKLRRQRIFLLFLGLVLVLIAYYYWVSFRGIVATPGIPFDSSNYVAFVRLDKDGNTDLYAVRADGFGLRRLSEPNDKSNKRDPAWTTDGKNLIYVSNRNDVRTWQVYLLGNGATDQLTWGTGNKDTPLASPDGKRIAFISQGAIKIVYRNGNEPYQKLPPPSVEDAHDEQKTGADAATALRGPFLSAAISSDGDGFAGVKELRGDTNPTMVDTMVVGDQASFVLPPGSEKSVLLDMGRDLSVAWDPTGPRLASAYSQLQIRDDKDNPNSKTHTFGGITLWTFANPTKPVPQRILLVQDDVVEFKNIAWSPDGKRLAFEGWQRKSNGEMELKGIVVIEVRPEITSTIATAAEAQHIPYMLPATADIKPQRPLWSPDGTRLLYETTRKGGGRDLWVINTDGTDPLNLTKGEGDNSQAAWSPVRSK